MSARRPGETDAQYYSRLDREFDASPYVQAARMMSEHDRDCRSCRVGGSAS